MLDRWIDKYHNKQEQIETEPTKEKKLLAQDRKRSIVLITCSWSQHLEQDTNIRIFATAACLHHSCNCINHLLIILYHFIMNVQEQIPAHFQAVPLKLPNSLKTPQFHMDYFICLPARAVLSSLWIFHLLSPGAYTALSHRARHRPRLIMLMKSLPWMAQLTLTKGPLYF